MSRFQKDVILDLALLFLVMLDVALGLMCLVLLAIRWMM